MEENQVQEQEVAQQEYQEPAAQEAPKQVVESNKEYNIRVLRERAERAEQALKRHQDQQDQYRPQPQYQAPVQQEDFSLNIGDDDLVEGKQVKAMFNEVKKVREELKSYKQQSADSSAEIKLQTQFSDFKQVFNAENLQLLSSLYPELAQTIAGSTADVYNKSLSAYQLIKRLGIAQDQETQDQYSGHKAMIEKNLAKPKPTASINPTNESPLSKVNPFTDGNLTEETKRALWEDMQKAISKRAFR